MKILFYPHSSRAFRTTLIGHLFEVAQVYPTVLITEQLDLETGKVIARKDLFPRLEKVIPVRQIAGGLRHIFANSHYLCTLARRVMCDEQPDVVIVGSDLHSLFERYLCCFAKRSGATVVAIQPTFAADGNVVRRWLNLEAAYSRFPSWVLCRLKIMLIWLRKMCAHVLEYWIAPCISGTTPFLGLTSHILRFGNSGMRDADFQVVLSKRDWVVYKGDGIPPEKLYTLLHPLTRDARRIFEIAYLAKVRRVCDRDQRIAVVFLPGNVKIGFRKSDESLISQKEKWQEWEELLRLMCEKLTGWTISVRLHPDTPDVAVFQRQFGSLSSNIEVSAQGYADEAIEQSDLIVGFPLSASTTLYTASLQCPGKPILSLDFEHELLGDVYKNFKGIEYIDSKEQFIQVLEAIRMGRYVKPSPGLALDGPNGPRLSLKQFSNTIEMVECLSRAQRCPSCDTFGARRLGGIPPIHIPLVSSLFYSSFYQCLNCELCYRWPRLDPNIQERLYEHPEVEYLKGTRRDWEMVKQRLSAPTGAKSILELGCFDGAFLASLQGQWEWYGIELNQNATARAERNGIKIVGRDFCELLTLPRRFEAVVAIDVLEHTEAPARLLQDMLHVTSPGGTVIVSTGNTSSWSWRMMKGCYWYCMFPGHISFVNDKWCRYISEILGTPIVAVKHFSHGAERGLLGFIVDSVKNMFYKLSPRIFGMLRDYGFGGIDVKTHPELQYHPPNWRSAKDHMMVVFQKPR